VKRILLIEDQHPYMVQGIIETQGKYRVDFVKTGTEAMGALLANRYDLVLLDLRLPGLHGLRVLEAIRHAEPDVPVIITSAFGDKKNREQAKLLGAAAYFTKPIDFRRLHQRMGEVIAQAENKQQTRPRPEFIEGARETIRFTGEQAEQIAKMRRLLKLKEQAAQMGLNTPPHILTEIEDIEGELAKYDNKSA
jgi:two-component system, response regulator, stage 0 sporulation protein F